MKHQTSNRIQATICAVLAAVGLFAQVTFADPAETTTLTLRRGVEQGNRLEGKLSKNLYRQEPYQAEYQEQEAYTVTESYVEQVPYQTTETYTVQVPYERQESYTEYETYYTSEHRCETAYENKCAYESICRPVTTQQCRNENVCHSVPGQQVCRTVEECGTNALGQPICKQRQVCEGGGSTQQCHNEQRCNNVTENKCSSEYRCNNVPVQKCGYVNVPHQRAVTKYRTVTDYRTETRTREVTKYNSVTKYHDVVKYKTVTKCCVTKYKKVFDQQKVVDVEILFPSAAILEAGEAEKLKITLQSVDANAVVALEVLESVYGYKVLSQTGTDKNVRIELDLAPKYSAAEVGEASIEALMLVGAGEKMAVAFNDKGIRKKTTTQYTLRIIDPAGAVISEQSIASNGAAKVQLPIPALDPAVKYDAELRVRREGAVLAGAVEFVKLQKALGSLEATPFADATQVGKFGLTGNKATTAIAFRDISPRHESVVTEYQIAVLVGGQQIVAKTIQRAALPVVAGGLITIIIVKDLGLAADVAKAQLKSGKEIVIQVAVVRSGPFSSGPQITIPKKVSLVIP
ncbi:MAG: hypothetical protein V4736_06065 [Bdellovibrionota bacterium]